MKLSQVPLFEALGNSNDILLAGAGGGFDVFGALPLYFALRGLGKNCHLANFSFTFPELGFPFVAVSKGFRERMLSPTMFAVDADTPAFGSYFPELFLSRWFMERGEEVPVYTFATSGVAQLSEGYRVLADRLGLDAVVLVDGGADSLMRGDETDLATPSEDIASIVAVDGLDVPVKILACVGFGVDWYHGLSHGRAIEASADIAASGGFMGIFSLIAGMPEADLYREACEYVFARMPGEESVVSSSILSALEGRFGDCHASERTRKGPPVDQPAHVRVLVLQAGGGRVPHPLSQGGAESDQVNHRCKPCNTRVPPATACAAPGHRHTDLGTFTGCMPCRTGK